MKRLTRKERNRIHLVGDEETKVIFCPYCGKDMQFLHWKHLKDLHGKNIRHVRKEFPSIPTMTKMESEKRSKARKLCEDRIIQTCNKLYGGIGYSSKKLLKDSQDTTKRKFGRRNIMKTDHGKSYFAGDLNPMKDPEIAAKVSESMAGRESPLKGKTYEEILGPEKAEIRREQQVKAGVKGQMMTPKISTPQKELFRLVKQKYPTAVMEYPVLDYCLDIAVPELKLCFEYDGSYWHDEKKDKKRDEVLGKLGWKVTRFIDDLPYII